MITSFLGVALVAAPFILISSSKSSPALSQEYFFAIASMLGALMFGIKRVHWQFRIMALALVFMAIMSPNPFGPFQYYHLAMGFSGIVYMALVYSHKENIHFKTIGKWLGLVCCFESAWVILQYFHLDPHHLAFELLSPGSHFESVAPKHITFGSMGNQNLSGALIAATIPFATLPIICLASVALYLGNSTMPVISAVMGVVAYVSIYRKDYRILYAGGFCLAIAALCLIFIEIPRESYFSDSYRLDAWKALLNDVGFTFFGNGIAYVPSVFSQKLIHSMRFYQAHNEWLELYAVGGLCSVAVALFLVSRTLKNIANPAIGASMIALLVNSLGSFTFHSAPLFMVLGTCYALTLKEEF